MIIKAQCHCGNIEARLTTQRNPDELNPRTCPCRFCSMHGARYLSDAQGTASISVKDSKQMIRYRFGENSADFLICKLCGTYVAAVIEEQEQEQCWSALNLNLTDHRELQAPEVSRWQGQSHDERIAFRKTVWTPTMVSLND